MNKQFIFVFGILVLIGALVFLKKNKKEPILDWENQTIFQSNREKPRAHFFPFESKNTLS